MNFHTFVQYKLSVVRYLFALYKGSEVGRTKVPMSVGCDPKVKPGHRSQFDLGKPGGRGFCSAKGL